ncbi:hypothetical protein ANCCAN_15055 [Ancylostoma caninum]|uniref:CB1 cannabinoid receptor-interacting protein 1 n=1 Tax=Ancylostoma caninum TaxID=29170 RepID=A0A368G3K2_ANCCA|nr:hypothetical protein ANCCAN_15055 [Ancylostoma caninum]
MDESSSHSYQDWLWKRLPTKIKYYFWFINVRFCSRAESGEAVAYKVDGERFEGGSRTLKFATNTRYKITLTSKPPVEFHHMHLAGSDLQLHTDDPKSGQYSTEWNTTGIDVCKKGARNNIGLTLQVKTLMFILLATFKALWNPMDICMFHPNKQGCIERAINLSAFPMSDVGPGGLLKRQLQSKFYQKDDSHADWGTKLEFIQWTCAVDGTGSISVTEELIK